MMLTLTAIYENGGLRPLMPLALPEQSQVVVHIQDLPTTSETHRQQVREALQVSGLSSPVIEATPLSPVQRAVLAASLPKGLALSDLIGANREPQAD